MGETGGVHTVYQWTLYLALSSHCPSWHLEQWTERNINGGETDRQGFVPETQTALVRTPSIRFSIRLSWLETLDRRWEKKQRNKDFITSINTIPWTWTVDWKGTSTWKTEVKSLNNNWLRYQSCTSKRKKNPYTMTLKKTACVSQENEIWINL